MGTQVIVRGRGETRPGVYAETKSGIKNTPSASPFGNICIIDTGLGAGFASGGGINGSLTNGKNAIYEFNNIRDFRNHVKGGELWQIAEPLFVPAGRGINGVSKIYFVKAATTTPAEGTYNFTNGDVVIQPLDEGTGANGVLSSGNLSKGFAYKFIKGTTDTTKYMIQFWVGSYKGPDALNSNVAYDGVTAILASPVLVAQSPEVSTLTELFAWCGQADNFLSKFKLKATSAIKPTVTGTITVNGASGAVITAEIDSVAIGSFTSTGGTLSANAIGLAANINTLTGTNGGYTATPSGATVIVTGPDESVVGLTLTFTVTGAFTATGGDLSDDFTASDFSSNTGYKLASGGTEVYNSSDFDDCLPKLKEVDNMFFLSTEYGANATSINNTKLLDFVTVETKYQKYIVVAGGFDRTTFKGTATTNTQGIVEYFNSDSVIVTHAGLKKKVRGQSGLKVCSQLYKAAGELGRICGIAPPVPVTLKTISIDADIDPMDEDDQKFCIKKGILYTYYDTELESFVVGQGINSLQNNEFLVNEDGTSFSIAVKRITSELNKEIMVTAKRRFFGNNNGPTRGTVSEHDIKQWLEVFLESRVANDQNPGGLIIDWGNIDVTVDQDNYRITYSFVPNFEISKMIFTGIILDK